MRAAAGSVEELFRRAYAPLVRTLAVAVGPEAAADAVQEAFLQADRHWRKVRGLDDPVAWVRRVAINRVANHRRELERRQRALTRIGPTDPANLGAGDVDLQAAIRALPERQQLAVCLFYLDDLRIEDIAAALGVTTGTVKSNLHDARRVLRAHLEVRDG
jgi:RNA polymerase sigma-70 factor (ECF subfamily)